MNKETGNTIPVCRSRVKCSGGRREESRELLNGWTKTFISIADTARSRMMCGLPSRVIVLEAFPYPQSRAELSSANQPRKTRWEWECSTVLGAATVCSVCDCAARIGVVAGTRQEVAACRWEMDGNKGVGWGWDSSSALALFVGFQCITCPPPSFRTCFRKRGWRRWGICLGSHLITLTLLD